MHMPETPSTEFRAGVNSIFNCGTSLGDALIAFGLKTATHTLDHGPFLKNSLSKPEKADTTGINGSYHDGLLARFESRERIRFRRRES